MKTSILLFVVLLCMPMLVSAQQPATPSCEQQLAAMQSRVELLGVSREQGESVAAQALSNLRQQLTEAQAKVRSLEEQLKPKDETPKGKK